MAPNRVVAKKRKQFYDGWLPAEDNQELPRSPRIALESSLIVVAKDQTPACPCQNHISELLAHLYALYVAYQSAHWCAMSDSYYGDHLLYKRLYEDFQD